MRRHIFQYIKLLNTKIHSNNNNNIGNENNIEHSACILSEMNAEKNTQKS